MSPRGTLAAVVVSLLATSGIGWLARAPYDPSGGESGLLRLSWRLRGERVETCRTRTAAELAELAAHMRTPQVCEGRLVAYGLTVRVGDSLVRRARILPGGARGDRPFFVLRDYPLPPGPHHVRISFVREWADGLGTDRDSARAGRISALLLDTVLVAEAGGIELITLDPASRLLVHRRSSAH
jgi:hypothetical protein